MTQKQQTENHGQLSEKRIVVLGGSSGIALAVAQQVVARGDGKVEGHTLDLSNERNIQNFFQKIGDFDHFSLPATRCN